MWLCSVDGEVRILARVLLQCAFLASMPGLYRKKCKACQHANSVNDEEVRSISNLLHYCQ